ncbi:SDR family oxidoreductase [Aquibaculum arenosum]|uniref:SDR family oxidoreductase n=1 Tax=Aquibaculum arenosum TaxID=3032591 RepID=A0ABT5YQ77_9PROT|nr:SDR family oxidoreductase [Fodinicurvata sp. CAU 1616]MDF2097049.1 SDR family oxidoreductase [Fodinicurvata sp. CAU 1616]
MPSVVLTGANRGIGLALTRGFLAEGWQVHACCRHPEKATKLRALEGDLSLHRLEVTDALQVSALARSLADQPVDLLINNAGARGARGGLGAVDYDDWARVMAVNVMGPLRMAEQFAPLVALSEQRLIVNVSSVMGSIARNSGGDDYLYRSSKAALNMVTRSLAVDLAAQEITVVSVHPGWVSTDMGGASAPLTADSSAADLRRLFERLQPADSGGFFDHDGSVIPW